MGKEGVVLLGLPSGQLSESLRVTLGKAIAFQICCVPELPEELIKMHILPHPTPFPGPVSLISVALGQNPGVCICNQLSHVVLMLVVFRLHFEKCY